MCILCSTKLWHAALATRHAIAAARHVAVRVVGLELVVVSFGRFAHAVRVAVTLGYIVVTGASAVVVGGGVVSLGRADR